MPSEQLVERADIPSPQISSRHPTQSTPATPSKAADTSTDKTDVTGVGVSFPQKLLNVGFCTALILAAACFITGSWYLNIFLNSTNQGVQTLISSAPTMSPEALYTAINARLVMARLALLSCGVFVGMSFGFLGFALFLMGIKEEMNVAGRYEGYFVKIARLSPGVFVILCAAILIGICVTHDIPFEYHFKSSQTQSNVNSKQEKAPPDTLEPEDTSKP